MTKNKEQANTHGLVENIIKASGSTGSNMVTEYLPIPKAKAKRESGAMAIYNNGNKKNEETE